MKYLKYFERRELVLYKNDDFRICYSSNDTFSYISKVKDSYAISAIPELIKSNSKYLSDDGLRNIVLRDKDINAELEFLRLYPDKIKNIEKFHSGMLSGFLRGDRPMSMVVYKDGISDNVYMNLTFKYYPLLEDVVKNSKTMGDIIDGFTIIYEQLMKDLPLEISKEKYNI